MKIRSITISLVFLLTLDFGLWTLGSLAQSVPSLINYQGRLSNPDGSPLVTADYQLTFNIFDATNGGNRIWGPQIFDGSPGQGHGSRIPVVQGYFNVLLGAMDTNGVSLANAFNGSSRYVEITVSNHPPILPRQQILSAPFALNSAKLGGADWSAVFGTNDPVNGKIPGTKLANGAVTAAHIGTNQVWLSSGNAGTVPGTNFVGTTDNQPLEFKVNGERALRLEPNGYSPNVIGGYIGNFVGPGRVGATIGGGGVNLLGTPYLNTASADFATIGGGWANSANGNSSTIGGGNGNTVSNATYAAIAGGGQNMIQSGATGANINGGSGNVIGVGAARSTIGGGEANSVQSNSAYSVVPGGQFNSAGASYSFAAGYRAKANHVGTFVWANSSEQDFGSSADGQFLIRASAVGINKTNPGSALDVNGTVTATAFVGSGALAARPAGTNVGPGGLAISADSGSQTLSGNGTFDVTNLTATIATTGRPVFVGLIGGTNNLNTSTAQLSWNGGSSPARGRFLQGTNLIYRTFLGGAGEGIPPSSFHTIGFPSAGTWIYKFQIELTGGGSPSALVEGVRLVAFEL